MTNDTTHAPIDGVIFDMDGLLLDSETLAMEAMEAAGRSMGYDMPLSFCRRMIGIPADQCRQLVRDTFGEDAPVEGLFEAQEVALRAMVDAGRLVTKEGVVPLLDYLDAERMPRAIATSSSRYRADHHLGLVGLLERFDVIVTRDDVTRGKPDPEPYLLAASKIGVAPAQCLALEDSPSGARAAQAAAIRTIVVPDLISAPDDVRARALFVLDDLHGALDYLKDVRARAR
ncbi:HAD family hydrolase [Tanticharoenia sakaeratensis]|uniref:Phosphatase/phosphohexomutase n=1 Tax=Tanticharoenia sakaeratensis NBRC 103193 TaxID=1231623 RepID=A0A0D6MNQ1_9PROT|nr:HAD family phosphatase [Tanticharoenia sakaeratensis]GAN54913.1 phosphatase/phosphohexomutase [Tanticharoenia sakaeratensis NBRC 103193]GBQ23516.1 phosphatase/phosphohexomutase [Tanticharoenia sakaeratensis NBRC 103193]